MEQVLVVIAILAIIYIIFKISSFAWRLFSFAVLVFLVWAYKDAIAASVGGFIQQLEADGTQYLVDQAVNFVGSLVDRVTNWIATL